MSLTQQISSVVERLSEKEQKIVLEFVESINPDDVLTSEDIEDIKEARAEYARGETIAFEDIDW